MHFRPTSRISSAAHTLLFEPLFCEEDDATSCSSSKECGELSVNVAAVYLSISIQPETNKVVQTMFTDALSHAGRPTCLELASDATFSYTDRICLGAAVVFGRACAALMNAFSGSESLDMLAMANITIFWTFYRRQSGPRYIQVEVCRTQARISLRVYRRLRSHCALTF